MPDRRGPRTLALAIALAATLGGAIGAVTLACGPSSSPSAAPNVATPDPGEPPAARPKPQVTPIGPGSALTCEDLEAPHRRALQADADAYRAALAARRLEPISLASRDLGPFPEPDAPALRPKTPPFTELAETLDGRAQLIILGELFDESSPFSAPSPPELVIDAAGDIWQPRRIPHLSPNQTVDVKACSWGCWGHPPPGAAMPPAYRRSRWLIPAGHHYRGTIDVEYTTPGLTVNVIDQNCGLPG